MDVNKDAKDDAVLYYTRGNLYAQQRRYEEAVQCYDIAIKTGREEAEFYSKKGVALSHLGRYEEAVQCYDKMIEIGGENIAMTRHALARLERDEDLIECCDKMIEIDGDNIRTYNDKMRLQDWRGMRRQHSAMIR